jgi:hypothetical protein
VKAGLSVTDKTEHKGCMRTGSEEFLGPKKEETKKKLETTA